MPTKKGSIHLFHLLGIDVYLHYSWFLVGVVEVLYLTGRYGSVWWTALEYLCLFGIVLTHEFGHALACRSVGGKADTIVLWPLGGVAYVDPPQRPGAMLWSIAAGPLVNVLLIPLLTVAKLFALSNHWSETFPNANELMTSLWIINIGLLIFNMLPIYPLDGGKVLWALLWFPFGRGRSLMIASTLGFITVGLLLIFAIRTPWLAIMAVFALMQCWTSLKSARYMAKMDAAPKRVELACPHCHQPPPLGEYWVCGNCRRPFDMFAMMGRCPHCAAQYAQGRCPDCGQYAPFDRFARRG